MEPVKETPELKSKEKKGMTAQSRLMLLGLTVSTAFILGTAGFSTYSIDKNMNTAYKSFGQVLSKTLAIEGVELTSSSKNKSRTDS